MLKRAGLGWASKRVGVRDRQVCRRAERKSRDSDERVAHLLSALHRVPEFDRKWHAPEHSHPRDRWQAWERRPLSSIQVLKLAVVPCASWRSYFSGSNVPPA